MRLGDLAVFFRLEGKGFPDERVDIEVVGLVDDLGGGSVSTLLEGADGASEDEVLPGGDGGREDSDVVPLGLLVGDLRVDPLVLLDVVDPEVRELRGVAPAAVDEELVLGAEDRGDVTAARLRLGRVQLVHVLLSGPGIRAELRPLEGLGVEGVEVVEGLAGVADSSVSSEDVDFALVVGRRCVSSGFRGSDFRLRVFRGALRLLVLGLGPGPVAAAWIDVEDVDVIESVLGGVVSSEDQDLIILKGATCVVRSGLGNISAALDRLPFVGIVLISREFQSVDSVGWFSCLTLSFLLLQSSEKDMKFSDSIDGVTRTGTDLVLSLFDFHPLQRLRLDVVKKKKKNDKFF